MPPDIRKGLEGVVADRTTVSRVDPETGTLTYRGYPVPVLAESCSFEEVVYLLWNGELPTRPQLKSFQATERRLRQLPVDLQHVLRHCPPTAHPMDVLRTAVSFLGMMEARAGAREPSTLRAQALDLLAKIPTIVAYDARVRQGLDPIPPRGDLSLAANVFWMMFGRVPHPDVVKAFEVTLVLYAEHGFNASTFAARVVTSTLADLHGAITAGIATLKGALHGGANEAVMADLAAVGTPANARTWLSARLAAREKVMGFGHRVYKNGDSRVPLAAAWGRRVAAIVGNDRWHSIADALKDGMMEYKGIHPNLDFETGPIYALMGFDTSRFTPIFVMGRVAGWVTHVMEQSADNRLIRPLSSYEGPPTRAFVPIEERVPPNAGRQSQSALIQGPRSLAAARRVLAGRPQAPASERQRSVSPR